MTDEEVREHVLGVALVQVFGVKAGLHKFGARGETAVAKELKQHKDMKTYIPVNPEKLTEK